MIRHIRRRRQTMDKKFNLSNEAYILDGLISSFSFQLRNDTDFEKTKDNLNSRFYSEDNVKMFIQAIKDDLYDDWKSGDTGLLEYQRRMNSLNNFAGRWLSQSDTSENIEDKK